jgi:hypothetical protein
VQVIDFIGFEPVDEIAARIESLVRDVPTSACSCSACAPVPTATISTAPKLSAVEPARNIPLDRARYFVIVPVAQNGLINVEHYAYDHALLRTIEGQPPARSTGRSFKMAG